MRLVTAFASLVLLAGCAGSQARTTSARERELEDQLFDLQERLDAAQSGETRVAPTKIASPAPTPEPVTPPIAEPEAPAPAPTPVVAPAPVRPPARVPVVVAPPRAPIPLMYGTAPGQCGEVFRLEIQNRTQYFLRVHVRPTAGRAVGPAAEQGGIIQIAPRDRYMVCLSVLGQHSIRGIAYAPNGRQMVQVNRFQITRTFSPRSMSALGRQVIRVDSMMLNFH